MKKNLLINIFSLSLLLFGSYEVVGQTNVCSGSYTSTTNDCQNFTVGDGTAGFIEVCLDANNFPTGGGTSCNPGGACNPPFGGGGWSPRFAIYDSGGNLIGTFFSTSAVGDCITVPVNDGVAEIYGLCLTAGTTISWSTVDACGNDLCAGSPPTCNPPGACDCANPCGPACGFATPPTVADVTSTCTEYEYNPPIGPFETNSSSCYTFVAASTSVDFNVIVTSDCGMGGNVTNFTWEAYATGSCGAALWSGTLAGLTMTPTVIGQSYTFCYEFDTPGCVHDSHYPYFVGASALPIVLQDFTALAQPESIELEWTVLQEVDNDYFTIERSTNGDDFYTVATVDGRGTDDEAYAYRYTDLNPEMGKNYYRLSHTDEDGKTEVLKTVDANFTLDANFNAEVAHIYSLGGTLVKTVDVMGKDINAELFNHGLDKGIYLIQAVNSIGKIHTFKYYAQ